MYTLLSRKENTEVWLDNSRQKWVNNLSDFHISNLPFGANGFLRASIKFPYMGGFLPSTSKIDYYPHLWAYRVNGQFRFLSYFHNPSLLPPLTTFLREDLHSTRELNEKSKPTVLVWCSQVWHMLLHFSVRPGPVQEGRKAWKIKHHPEVPKPDCTSPTSLEVDLPFVSMPIPNVLRIFFSSLPTHSVIRLCWVFPSVF